MTLKQKALSGVVWTFTDIFLVKGLSFVAMLFLARWLGPKEFGLIGMIAVFIGIGTSLIDSGLSSSIIRTKNGNDSDFSTVFYMNIGMSILVYMLLFFIAPYIADFYQQDILINVIRVYCLSFIISAFSAVQLAILNKTMQFKRLMILNIPSTIIGVIVGLSMGYYNYGVWSIVAMYLTSQFVLSQLLWINSSWRPNLTFSNEKLKQHYRFGYKLLLAGLLEQVFNNIYNILIGKFFPVQTLGYYERAKQFNEYPSLAITSVVGKVSYPMLSKMQDDRTKLSFVYKKMIRLTFFISAPVMMIAAAIALPLFDLILGEEWVAAVPIFQILCISSMFYPIHAFNINIFKVFGRSDLFLKLEIIKKTILIFAIFIGFQFGIFGLVWSSVITSILSLFINTHFTSKFIDYKQTRQLLDLLPILLVSVLMFFIIYIFSSFFSHYSSIKLITFSVLIGILLYIIASYLIPKNPIHEIFKYKQISYL